MQLQLPRPPLRPSGLLLHSTQVIAITVVLIAITVVLITITVVIVITVLMIVIITVAMLVKYEDILKAVKPIKKIPMVQSCCRIKRKDVLAKQPEKNASSWSLSEDDFEHNG